MSILFAAVCLLLFLLAGADMFVSQFNADELNRMGVERR